jgi:hypothetical protein
LIKVSSEIPKIAYKIPDHEAFAQLTLMEVGTGQVKTCLQSTLSNGWSTHKPSIAWSIGSLAIVALFSAAWKSFLPNTVAPFCLLNLLGLYQTIASSGFFGLNYPIIYQAFTPISLGQWDYSLSHHHHPYRTASPTCSTSQVAITQVPPPMDLLHWDLYLPKSFYLQQR